MVPVSSSPAAATDSADDGSAADGTEVARYTDIRRQNIEYARSDFLRPAVERLSISKERLRAYQKERLLCVVAHAKERSPYYRKRLSFIDDATMKRYYSDDTMTVDEIALQLPTISKRQVAEHWDEIVARSPGSDESEDASSRLTLANAKRHLNDLLHHRKENPYFDDKYLIAATGGSSGTRGVFVWDRDLIAAALADCAKFETWFDRQNLSNRKSCLEGRTRKKRTALIGASAKVHLSAVLHDMAPQLDPEREVKKIPVDQNLTEIVRQLNEYKPDRLMVYASTLELLALCQQKGELSIDVDWVLSMAEPLEDAARREVQKAWGGCEVIDGYGSTEIGAIAIEGPDHDGLIVCEDTMYLEVLSDSGEHDLENGSRVLMTRFYGNSFPLIRYEVTDSICVLEADECRPLAPAFRRMQAVKGRTDVYFEYENQIEDERGIIVKVPPTVFRSALVSFDAIVEYQVQQTPSGANILLITKEETGDCEPFDPDLLANKIRDKLESTGLRRPVVVNAAVVDALPRHAETGKLRRFVPMPTT